MTPSLEPTRARDVLVAALVAFAAVVLGLAWWQGRGASLPVLGVVAWVPALLLAIGVGVLSVRTRRVLATDRTRLDNEAAVRRAVLGKASQLAGALLAGGYAGLVLLASFALPAPLAIERVVHGVIAVLTATAWAFAGWRLEVACRIPPDEDTADPSARG